METTQLTGTALIQTARLELLKAQYTELSMKGIERLWVLLERYMQTQGFVYFSKEVGMTFLEERYRYSTDTESELNKDRLRAIQLLADVQSQNRISTRRKRVLRKFAPPFEDVFNDFIEFRKRIGISGRTLESYSIYLERFASYLVDHAVNHVSEIDVSHVHGFIQFTAASYRTATVYCTSCLLRVLFRYLFEQQLTSKNLSLFVPSVKCNKKSKIPSAYTQEEIQRILSCVDRGNPKGKRDYAMLLIAVRLGLRASDICGLTFDNLKWETNTIELLQEKTEKRIVLPLLNEIGEALIDYMKYGRPAIQEKAIFLRLSAPVGPMAAPTLHSIVTFYMHKANIFVPEGKKHGPHALRHSLASALLHQNTPMPVISEILGHTDSQTTSGYLKIDILHLRNYALDVPPVQVVWMGEVLG